MFSTFAIDNAMKNYDSKIRLLLSRCYVENFFKKSFLFQVITKQTPVISKNTLILIRYF